MDRSVFANDDLDVEWGWIGKGDSDPVANDGVVSDRFRVSAAALGVLLDVRNCAADADDLSILGVVEPLNTVDISSPLADRPAVAYWELLCDLFSVDVVPWLPLLVRFKYLSIASASLSLIRLAIGDNPDEKLGGLSIDPFDVPDAELYAAALLEGRWLRKMELDPVEGWDGEDDSWPACELSRSPLSDVAVVRLVPDPLLIRE